MTQIYQIRVRGHLSGAWSEWFDGLAIENLPNGEALLSGPVAAVAQFQQKAGQLLAGSKAVGHIDGERNAYQFLVSHRYSSHSLDSAVITVQLVPQPG